MSASASASQSSSDSHNIQATTQGASGANSPTITAGSNVSYNDPQLQLATVQALADTISQALGGAGNLSSQAIKSVQDSANATQQQDAAINADQASVLQAALNAQSELALAQGTGGQSLTTQSTNYLIWGAIAVAIAAVFAIFGHHNK